MRHPETYTTYNTGENKCNMRAWKKENVLVEKPIYPGTNYSIPYMAIYTGTNYNIPYVAIYTGTNYNITIYGFIHW